MAETDSVGVVRAMAFGGMVEGPSDSSETPFARAVREMAFGGLDRVCAGAPGTLVLRYRANGGTGSMPDSVGTRADGVAVSQCAFVPPEGGEFSCWTLSTDGNGTTIALPFTVTESFAEERPFERDSDGALILYAAWNYPDAEE